MQQRESEISVGEQMPPLATEQVDVAAVAAVRAWIAAMPRARAPVADAEAAPPLVTVDAGPSEMMPALADAGEAAPMDAGEPAPMDAGEPAPMDAGEPAPIDAGDGSDAATLDASAVDPEQTNPDAGAAEVEPDV
jgi:hypothetical protein